MAIYKTLVKKISVSADMKTKQKEYLKKGKLAIVDQGQQLIGGYSDNENKKVDCNLPVIVFGDHTRCVKYISFPFGAGADGTKILAPQDGILPKYLYYGTQYLVLKMPDKGYARHYQHLEKMELPVPETEVQKQIVDKIEELLSEIDSGIDTLLKTKEQLYAYRQAVLKDAFSIYNKNGTIDICNITDDIRIGPFGTMLHKSDYVAGGVPVINPQHIKNNAIKPSKNVTVNEAKANELSAYRLKANDIIMGRRGEMGRTAPVSINEAGWICGTGSILFRLKPEYDAEFYSQILSSPDVVHYLEENATGTTMKNLNEGIVAHIPVPIVTRKMQDRIKLVMDEKLSVCEDIEKTVEKTLEQAEAMRQSVLKNAFEGEL
ncbi:restriction endonuclease subunit S [Butyrivibrio fibrisolvens]|uniref:restriction endonuclease subunit S n=1 Tax=Butyrivibrio fibrisolvens TaxID=831 RepID=UPI00040620FF|nr:restriction endonuclease subunit S [Butyrivibrio fibrisolvens]